MHMVVRNAYECMLRNGPDKNDSNNSNEHVGIQLEWKKVITFLLSVLTSHWLKQQKLTKLHKAELYPSLLSNHLPFNKIWSQFEYHRNRMWGTCKIVNVAWLSFSTLVIGQKNTLSKWAVNEFYCVNGLPVGLCILCVKMITCRICPCTICTRV